jgi:hypothetical protein
MPISRWFRAYGHKAVRFGIRNLFDMSHILKTNLNADKGEETSSRAAASTADAAIATKTHGRAEAVGGETETGTAESVQASKGGSPSGRKALVAH